MRSGWNSCQAFQIWNPRPVSDATNSTAVMTITAVPAATRRPVKIDGRDAGRITKRNLRQPVAPYALAASRTLGSIWRIPARVLIWRMKKTAISTDRIFGVSVRPKISSISGRMAIFGSAYSAVKVAPRAALSGRHAPIARPTATPRTQPRT